MPWTEADAREKNKSIKSAKRARQWAHIANRELQSGKSEAAAIQIANGVLRQQRLKRKAKKKAMDVIAKAGLSMWLARNAPDPNEDDFDEDDDLGLIDHFAEGDDDDLDDDFDDDLDGLDDEDDADEGDEDAVPAVAKDR